MKKQLIAEAQRMQKLAGILKENEEETDNDFDSTPDWNNIKILGTETDHQGIWVIFADPEDPYLEEEGWSFAVQKKEIDQAVKGERNSVNDGDNNSLGITSQDAKNILSKI
jgi:hypothetical protein